MFYDYFFCVLFCQEKGGETFYNFIFLQYSHVMVFLFVVDQKHFMAIGQMGNYQEYLKMVAPLREVDPGQSRLHAFGNPFKLKQDHQVTHFIP